MTGLDWQLVAVAAAVLAATGYLARSAWATWSRSGSAGCGSGCGKCPTHEPRRTEADRRRIPLN